MKNTPIVRRFLENRRAEDRQAGKQIRTLAFWAERWFGDATKTGRIGRWSRGDRRPEPDVPKFFEDLLEWEGISMEEFFRRTPKSDKKQRRKLSRKTPPLNKGDRRPVRGPRKPGRVPRPLPKVHKVKK